MTTHDQLDQIQADLAQARDHLERLDTIASTLTTSYEDIDEELMALIMADAAILASRSFDIIDAIEDDQDILYWYAFKAMNDFVMTQLFLNADYLPVHQGTVTVIGDAYQAISNDGPYRLPESFRKFVDNNMHALHASVKATITPESRAQVIAAVQDFSDLMNEDLS